MIEYGLALFTARTAGSQASCLVRSESGLKVLFEERATSPQVSELLNRVIPQVKKAVAGHEERLTVIVNPGPGSLTGIRMGVAAAQGLCRGLNCKQLLSVNLAQLFTEIPVTVALDGRNGFFFVSEAGSSAFRAIPYADLRETVSVPESQFYVFRDDQEKFIQLGGALASARFEFLDEMPLARMMASCALTAIERTPFVFRGPDYGLQAFTNGTKLAL